MIDCYGECFGVYSRGSSCFLVIPPWLQPEKDMSFMLTYLTN